MSVKIFASSLAFKLTLILSAMGGIIFMAVLIASSIFNQTIFKLDQLSKVRLPELTSASTLATASTELSTGLVSLISAETLAEMQQGRLQVDNSWSRMKQENDSDAAHDLKTLADVRSHSFEAMEHLVQRADELRGLSYKVSEQLLLAADQAVRDVTSGGVKTTDNVERTLSRLINTDLKTLEIVYGMQASANMAIGISVALTNTSDPVLVDIFREINTEALTQLKALNNELIETAPIEFNQKRFLDAVEALEKVNTSAPSVARTQRRFVMKARATLDSLFTRASGEVSSILSDSSFSTSTDNADAIKGLLDGPVQNLKDVSALNLAVADFFGVAMEVFTAQDLQAISTQRERLNTSRVALSELIDFASDEVRPQINQIIAFSDPETGIISDRVDVLSTQTEALTVMRHAASRVVKVGQLAAELSLETTNDISQDADALLSNAQNGQEKFSKIAIAAAALFMISVALTVLWIARPMWRLTRNTEKLAKGDLETEIGFEKDHSEIGRMAMALRVFRDGLKESKLMEEGVENDRKTRAEQQRTIVAALAGGLKKLSDGDLSAEINADFPSEYAKLRDDFNLAVRKLGDVMQQITVSSRTVKESSDEILAASDSLASRTEKSAAALEESSNSLNHLKDSINGSAATADTALTVVNDARQSAENGKSVIQSTVSAMNQIAASSTEVRKINDLIDDIAFQTNLLALNAGVEAARAGEAGRGFAVVATEVRMLAQRATDAAQEIGTLLNESGIHIEKGVSLVEKTEAALTQINGFVEQVADQVSEIATAAQGQAKGVSELNAAVGELDHDTQRNTAMFEETKASSVNLNSEANILAQAIAEFKISGTARRILPDTDIAAKTAA